MPSPEQRAPRPVTDADYDQVRALHRQGLGRNDIARRLDRSGQVVSRLASEMGLSFARAGEVAAATEVRRADLAARRYLLAEQLQADAENLRAQLWRPATVFAFGGKDNEFNSRELPEPPAVDKKNLMATIGMAVDRSLKLVPPIESTGVDDARSMLGKLFGGLKALAEQAEEQAPDDEGDGDAP